MKSFYVYIYKDVDGTPFYVGKGTGNRWRHHLKKSHNKQVTGRITKIKQSGHEPIIQVIDAESEADALELESCLITLCGKRHDNTGTLWNYSNGGQGTTWSPDISHERRLEITNKGMLAAAAANRGRKQNRESVELRRAKQIGKPRSDAMKEKLRETLGTKDLKFYYDPITDREFRLDMNDPNVRIELHYIKGRKPFSASTKAKLSEKAKARHPKQ
jgi:hypothetical protein